MNGQNDHSQDFGFIFCLSLELDNVTLDCITKETQIGPLPENGNTYQWDPPTGLSASNIAQPIVNVTSNTTYTLTINDFCKYSMNVTVDQIPPIIYAGLSGSIDCNTKSYQIGSPALPDLIYRWEPAASLNNATIAQPIASPSVTTTYTLTVTGLNGCTSQATTTVNVSECCTRVEIPNSFTPNGDQVNDQFGVIEIENLRDFKLVVFNRWGQQLFESISKNNKWDGMFKGVKCEVGTYFYILTYDCATQSEKKQLQGDITLLR
jgi:gliding motility-associated-like protein